MGMDQYLYARFSVYDTKSYEGSPVDIPLSAEPSCGKRHFEKVDYLLTEILYWRRDQGVDEYMRRNAKREVSEDIGYVFIEIKKSAIIDLRDELLRIAEGKEQELAIDHEFYENFEGNGKDKKRARADAEILDKYLHEDDETEFYYCSSW